MIMYLENYANQEDYDNDYPTMYEVLFSKKRLIKALQRALGVSDWKQFLKEEYNSDDTQEIMNYFDEHGWKYKQVALQQAVSMED